MKKIITLLFICICAISFAQEDKKEETTTEETKTVVKKKSEFWKKVRFAPGLGFNLTNGYTSLAITPTAIYQFNEQFAAGAGLGYRYTKTDDFKNNVFSVNALALYNPVQQFQLSAEIEQLFVNRKVGTFSNSYNYPSLNLGASYRLGRILTVGLQYDVLYDESKSIYGSAFTPIIRAIF